MTNGLIKPSEQFQQEIQPALDDYLEDPLSERVAKNLARAIDHQVDWTFEYYQKNDRSRLNGARDVKSFRRQLVTQCSELQIMNDLPDAAHSSISDVAQQSSPRRRSVVGRLFTAVAHGRRVGATLHFNVWAIPACCNEGRRVLAQLARLMTSSPIGLNVTEGRFRSYFVCGTTIDFPAGGGRRIVPASHRRRSRP